MARIFKRQMDARRSGAVLAASAAAIIASLAILIPRHSNAGLSGDFWIGGLIGLSATLAIGGAILLLAGWRQRGEG